MQQHPQTLHVHVPGVNIKRDKQEIKKKSAKLSTCSTREMDVLPITPLVTLDTFHLEISALNAPVSLNTTHHQMARNDGNNQQR